MNLPSGGTNDMTRSRSYRDKRTHGCMFTCAARPAARLTGVEADDRRRGRETKTAGVACEQGKSVGKRDQVNKGEGEQGLLVPGLLRHPHQSCL